MGNTPAADIFETTRLLIIGLAAQLMRRVLVDEARRRQALKYGGEAVQISLANA